MSPNFPSHTSRRSRLLRLFAQILAIATPVTFLVFELVLRMTSARALRVRSQPMIYEPGPRTGYRYIPNSRGLLCNPDVCREVAINAEGYPGPSFSRKKPPGTYRIGVVGDSDGTGMWTAEGESFVSILGEMFQSVSTRIEVINFSVDGAERDPENVALVRELVPAYGLDLILLLHTHVPFLSLHVHRSNYRGYVLTYPRDFPDSLQIARGVVDSIERHNVLIALYTSLYAVRFATRFYFNRSSSDAAMLMRSYVAHTYSQGIPTLADSTTDSLAELVNLRDDVSAAGGQLIFIAADFEAFPEVFRHVGLDLMVYKFPTGEENQRSPNAHSTRHGHQEIASQIYAALLSRLPQGVLAEPVSPPGSPTRASQP